MLFRIWIAVVMTVGLFAFAGASRAGELSAGLYAHDVNIHGHRMHEDGAEAIATWRGERLHSLSFIGAPAPYVTGGMNTLGKTSFVAGGLSWHVKLNDRVYVRPGVGLAFNDAPLRIVQGRIHAGSNLTFEPELNLGVKLNDRTAVEASWIHLSQARLFNQRNPGINEMGVRLVVRFGGPKRHEGSSGGL